MAVKTKSKTEVVDKVLDLKVLILCLLLFAAFYYVWTKSYEVVLQSREEDNQGWTLLNIFSAGDHAVVETPSFTEKDFYLIILTLIRDDIISVWFYIVSFVPQTIADVIVQIDAILVLSAVSILLVTCYIYIAYFRDSNTDNTNKGGKERKQTGDKKKEKQDKSSDNRRRGLVASCNKSKRFYWHWLTGLLFIAFLFSIPWEFVRLYQTMVAEKVTQMTTGIPTECMPEHMSVTQSLKAWLRWQFSWSNDPCLQYHKALLVDPMWQVPPLMVISSAFSHCLVYPVEIFFGGLGKAFRLFFSEIPTQWQPVMLIVMVTIIMLILIMMFGYRVHLPFILKFEPKTPVYLRVKERKKTGHESERNNLNFSIESSQDTDFCNSQDSQYTQDATQYTLDNQSF